ncbi:Imidazole glycerol phosphate synthase subunit HisF [Candidatus Hodgkinia cicadicola]|nr:Imidazole glycerol phosphate synthase subunit HisF [Candidatus Hodgkinia cicadicola]
MRKSKDVRKPLLTGADKAAINLASATSLGFISERADKFGSQCVAADCKAVNGAWEACSHGDNTPAGGHALEYAYKAVEFGASEAVLTSIDRHGLNSEHDLVALKTVSDLAHVPVIASGGVGAFNYLVLTIRHGGAAAVLATSSLHKGDCALSQIKYIYMFCPLHSPPVCAGAVFLFRFSLFYFDFVLFFYTHVTCCMVGFVCCLLFVWLCFVGCLVWFGLFGSFVRSRFIIVIYYLLLLLLLFCAGGLFCVVLFRLVNAKPWCEPIISGTVCTMNSSLSFCCRRCCFVDLISERFANGE